ncbi:MAG TPA: LamG domain-containing protein, partial [Pseudobdellovibrionaceae bacterium]|nr:LamG domain-containing protein [Pseudobdellovibrionaceae bacterium]
GDRSGSGHHLSETGGALPGQGGVLGRAVRLDGSNDSLSVALDLSGTNVVTISAWIKFFVKSGTPLAFEFTGNFNTVDSGGFIFLPLETSGALSGYATAGWRGNTGYNLKGFDSSLITLGEFQHFSFVFDSSEPAEKEVRIFMNGKELTAVHTVGTLQKDNTSNFANSTLFIGSRNKTSLRANAMYDDFAIWSRALSDDEILQVYRRGANRVKYQVRTCDDATCDTETWKGPDNTAASYFSELHNETAIDASGNGSGRVKATPLSLSFVDFNEAGFTLPKKPYFQYRAILESDDRNFLCAGAPCLPEIDSIHLSPATPYYGGNPSIVNKSGVGYSALQSLSLRSSGSCAPRYQLSRDGTSFYYWNGSAWVSAANGFTHSSLAQDLSSHVSSFSPAGGGSFFLKSFLPSDTTQSCALNGMELRYEP